MTIIGHSLSGKLVTIRRREGKIDIYRDGELFDREGSPPHWTKAPRQPGNVCEVCGDAFYGHCVRCRKNVRRREGRRG